MIQISPQLAYDSGLAKDPDAPDGNKEQTAEDIAKAENKNKDLRIIMFQACKVQEQKS